MAIRNIRVDGDDILRKKCKPVKEMTPRLKELIADMFETMYDADGVGLAGPQVGILKRLCVIDTGEEGEKVALINPEIIKAEGEQEGGEGCLSIPEKLGIVKRPYYVTVKALDEDMNEVEIEAEGFFARAICHELDHLDGVLYKDLAEGDLMSAEEFAEYMEEHGQSDEEDEE